MKNTIILVCLAALNFSAPCAPVQKADETAITLLIDVTDPVLFETIEADFSQNLNKFFHNTGLGHIDFGQKLTIRIAAIDDSGQLTLQSRSIALIDKKVSRKEADRLRDPRPLLELIRTQLDQYKQLSEKTMSSSPIIDVVLKSFCQMDPEAREILVICSDGVENSNYGNFYKSIPTTEQSVGKMISNVVDPMLLAEAKAQIADTNPEVILILKTNPKIKNIIDLKKFYNEFLHQLGVETFRVIDNLSNNPNL
ncbi:MAG: hypothetical protein K5920_06535 [Bacteroidales bacterium]|nr:hypothetical protein [Bacteroidales bacterium]